VDRPPSDLKVHLTSAGGSSAFAPQGDVMETGAARADGDGINADEVQRDKLDRDGTTGGDYIGRVKRRRSRNNCWPTSAGSGQRSDTWLPFLSGTDVTGFQARAPDS